MKYDNYKLNKREWIQYIAEYMFLSWMVTYLFFDSIWFFLISLPFFTLYVQRKKRELNENRLSEIKDEFLQMILSLSSALYAGYSLENALNEALSDMKNMYEEDAVIVKEIVGMQSRMKNGSRIEDEINDFALRTGAEEINDFAIVFAIAKKRGGNFTEIIKDCALIMRSERETETEIQILISGKRFEQKIMNIIPFVMIASLRATSPELIGVLYHNLFGISVMTFCLATYFGAIYLSEKISNIRC